MEKETDCSFKCSFTSDSGTRCQFNSTTRRGLVSHMVKAHGLYDPGQRAVITNECTWCRSIFSTLLDAQHHRCSSFLHGFCRAGGSHVQTEVKQPPLPVVCPLCKIEEIANQESERLFHMLNLFRCSFHLCPTVMSTSSGAICLHLVSRERGPQKLHSFVAPTMLFCGWQCAQNRERKGGTSAARRVSSKARSGQMPGSAPGDPMMVTDSPSTANGATGSERTRGNQSIDSLAHRLERIELPNDLCRTRLVEGDVASFQPFAAAKAQGKAHSEAARWQKGHQMGQPFMSVFPAFVDGLVTENPGGTRLAEVAVGYHQRQNNYRYRSEIKSKTFGL